MTQQGLPTSALQRTSDPQIVQYKQTILTPLRRQLKAPEVKDAMSKIHQALGAPAMGIQLGPDAMLVHRLPSRR